MKIRILEKKEQPLFYRHEYNIEVDFDNEVPKRRFLREQVSKASKVKENLIIIESIKPRFGEKVADVLAYVYDDEKKLNSFVSEHIKKRHELSEAEKKAIEDKKAEEVKEDSDKTEEPKKEAPAEKVEEKPEPSEEKKEGE